MVFYFLYVALDSKVSLQQSDFTGLHLPSLWVMQSLYQPVRSQEFLIWAPYYFN